ncbi:RNase P/RNase MRP complex subunit [Rhodotorula kratochvilovae]
MTTQAPALGGASTSSAATTKARASPWDPYAPLPPSTKRRLDPKDALAAQPYLQELSIPAAVADERVAGKLLQLDLPEGKISDWRKAELATRAQEKDKKRVKRQREGDCGLGGRRKCASSGKAAVRSVSYDAVLPVHHLWLGYISELLALPLLISPTPPSASTAPSTPATTDSNVSATLIPTFPSRHGAPPIPREQGINAVNLHTKMVKADFTGCLLSVKRAKNPSLVGLKGIVLQETQGTFKLVTPKSQIKVVAKQASVFNIVLPLASTGSSTGTRELSFDLFGDSFAYRPADRVGKKWKAGTSAGGVELV